MAMFGQPQKKEEKPKLLDTPSIQKQSDLANTKSAMLTDRLKAAYAPPSEAALSAEAGKTYQTAMDKASPYQAEFLSKTCSSIRFQRLSAQAVLPSIISQNQGSLTTLLALEVELSVVPLGWLPEDLQAQPPGLQKEKE